MSIAARCPAMLISAPASGQGKTSVTAALARLHRKAGRRVRVFKCGPDFLDPMILEQASGAPVYQLDLFMVGEAECRRLLHDAARDADLILVEGVMGLFDGDPSAADLAARFGLPVLAVIDGSAMAQTFGAIVQGLATYRQDVKLAAVVGNRVGSERHAQMLAESVPPSVAWLGAMPRDPDAALPERHLGLVQAGEIANLDARIERCAANLPAAAGWLPPEIAFAAPSGVVDGGKLLDGVTVAIARDAAFAFIYPANVEWLQAMGARIRWFSPLRDESLPECDAIWLPGGYPELHLQALSRNHRMIAALRAHHAAEKPILAECGGMLYCLDELEGRDGGAAAMAGLLPGRAVMQGRLAALGLQQVDLPDGALRGHTFHYSRLHTASQPVARAIGPDDRAGEAVYREGSLTASYVHLYFASANRAAARLFSKMPG